MVEAWNSDILPPQVDPHPDTCERADTDGRTDARDQPSLARKDQRDDHDEREHHDGYCETRDQSPEDGVDLEQSVDEHPVLRFHPPKDLHVLTPIGTNQYAYFYIIK